jgi:hypothetical protein
LKDSSQKCAPTGISSLHISNTEEKMEIPKLLIAQKSTSYLYDYLRLYEDKENFLYDAPANALTFYNQFFKERELVYQGWE